MRRDGARGLELVVVGMARWGEEEVVEKRGKGKGKRWKGVGVERAQGGEEAEKEGEKKEGMEKDMKKTRWTHRCSSQNPQPGRP